MSLDFGWLQDIGHSLEKAGQQQSDNTNRFMDNHGENVTKGAMLAALAYFTGGAGGGEEVAGGGGSSSGGLFSGLLGQGKNTLGNLGGMFGGGQQQQQQQPMYVNPFSPTTQIPKDSPYHPMQFQNASFTPWEQNVATMGMPSQSTLPRRNVFGSY
jgi:hypothetical protein